MNATRQKLALSLVALLTVLGVGAYGTFATFSDTTTNSGNSLTAGTLDIADGDAGVAMFEITDVKPGDSAIRCVTVSNAGSLAFAGVDIVNTVTAGTPNLAPALDYAVTAHEPVTAPAAGESAACTALTGGDAVASSTAGLAGFTTADPDTWAPNASKTYRFALTFPDGGVPSSPTTGDNVYQGASTSFAVAFTAQSAAGTARSNDTP